MTAYIDIENLHTQKVITYECPCAFGEIRLEIHAFNDEKLKILSFVISKDLHFDYTEIEMFFIDDEREPYF